MNYIFCSKKEKIIPAVAMAYHALQRQGELLCKLISNSMGELIDEALIPEYETIYLVGYSFTDATIETLESMLRKKNKVIWLDNHTSSFDAHKKLIKRGMELDKLEAVLYKSKTVIRIVWEFFNPTITMPGSVVYLDRWEGHDRRNGAVRYFNVALMVHDDYARISSEFWEDLIYNPESAATNELVTIGRYICISEKKKDSCQLSNIYIYKMEDDSEFAFLNSIGDRYMFDVAYQLFDACVSYYYDGKEWRYRVFSKKKEFAGKYAMKHGGTKDYRLHTGSFKKNKEDNVIYWDYLDERKVSSLYEHPKYKEYESSINICF